MFFSLFEFFRVMCAAEPSSQQGGVIPAPLSPVIPLRPIFRQESGGSRNSGFNLAAGSSPASTAVRQHSNVPVHGSAEYVRPATDVSHCVQLQSIGSVQPPLSQPVVSTQHLNLRPARPGICCFLLYAEQHSDILLFMYIQPAVVEKIQIKKIKNQFLFFLYLNFSD